MRMDERELPIHIEAFGKKGKITRVLPRTRCTRSYVIEWEDGTTERYKGAASRPWWITHILKSKETTQK